MNMYYVLLCILESTCIFERGYRPNYQNKNNTPHISNYVEMSKKDKDFPSTS